MVFIIYVITVAFMGYIVLDTFSRQMGNPVQRGYCLVQRESLIQKASCQSHTDCMCLQMGRHCLRGMLHLVQQVASKTVASVEAADIVDIGPPNLLHNDDLALDCSDILLSNQQPADNDTNINLEIDRNLC